VQVRSSICEPGGHAHAYWPRSRPHMHSDWPPTSVRQSSGHRWPADWPTNDQRLSFRSIHVQQHRTVIPRSHSKPVRCDGDAASVNATWWLTFHGILIPTVFIRWSKTVGLLIYSMHSASQVRLIFYCDVVLQVVQIAKRSSSDLHGKKVERPESENTLSTSMLQLKPISGAGLRLHPISLLSGLT